MDVDFDTIKTLIWELAETRGDWAGYPMPIEGFNLRLAPSFPYQGLSNVEDDQEPDTEDLSKYQHVNSWYSCKYDCEVSIYKNIDTGRIHHVKSRSTPGKRITRDISAIGISDAWDMKSELRAMATLSTLLKKRTFDQYVLTGSFMETSSRSGVVYLFRKLKPTVALSTKTGFVSVLTALCLHPIGYYDNTFAGCMVPTDDVIAHLQMMRGDEHKFWAKANQHSVHCMNSGI